jgi:TonB-dependent receptor
VIKAVTPDMDANTIGGTVNLRTLTAFDKPKPFFFGIAEGLQNNRQVPFGPTVFPYEVDMTTGRRFGRNQSLGLVVSGSASRRDNAVSVLDPDGWVRVRNTSTGDSIDVSNEIELQVADNDRTRYSITSSLDFRPKPETNLYLRGLYTRTRELERNSEFEITFTGNYLFPANGAIGRNTASSMELDISRDDEKEDMFSLSAGGTQRWGKLTMDFTGVATRGNAFSFGPDATFENPRVTDAQAPVGLDFTKYFYSVTPENPAFVNNPVNYNLNGLSWNENRSVENTFIGAADWRYDTRLGRFPAFLKFGTKVQMRDRDIDSKSDRFTNTQLTLAPWSEAPVGGLQGAARPFVQGSVDPFADFATRRRGSDSLATDAINTQIQLIDNDAYVTERITAGYLMGTAELGRLTAVGGVRVEATASTAEFWQLFENSRLSGAARFQFPTTTTSRERTYTNVLPSAIFKFDASKNLVLRAAYTSTIARPQFTQLASWTRANYIPVTDTSFDGTVTDNNPDLSPYTSANYDLSAEYYPSTGGSLSIAYFHKNIDNPIYTFRSTENNVRFDNRFFTVLRYTQQRNGDAGSLGGVELSWSQPLYFLPGLLKGFGVNTNVAFVTSSLRIIGRTQELPFLGQPDQVLNLIPYYQRGPIEVRFAYARRASFLSQVGTRDDGILDRYTSARETMDLNIRYQLRGPRWELLATARNLANAPEVGYQGNVSRYDLHVLTGRTFSLGLRTTRYFSHLVMRCLTLFSLTSITLIACRAPSNAAATTAERRTWLPGDHHVHSEYSVGWSDSTQPPTPIIAGDANNPIPRNAAKAREFGLAWMVSTDHGGPNHSKLNLERAYPEVQRARTEVPDLLLFFGMEFDTPGADHSSLIIPHTTHEHTDLFEIERRFAKRDEWPTNVARDTEGAMQGALRYMAGTERPPVLIANHPARSATGIGKYGLDTPKEFRDWNDAAPKVAVGMEGAPGHQAGAINRDGTIDSTGTRGGYSRQPTLGGFDQMSARVGGLWDALLGEGRRWWITATSDAHRNWREGGSDFWPGEYAKTYVHAAHTHADILDGVRNGRVFVATGDLVSEVDVAAETRGASRTGIGGTIPVHSGDAVRITMRVRDPESPNARGQRPSVARVDLIIGDIRGPSSDRSLDGNPTTEVVRRFTAADWTRRGEVLTMSYTIPKLTRSVYVRVRGTSTTELEPAPDHRGEDPWSDLWFYANPIFLTIR